MSNIVNNDDILFDFGVIYDNTFDNPPEVIPNVFQVVDLRGQIKASDIVQGSYSAEYDYRNGSVVSFQIKNKDLFNQIYNLGLESQVWFERKHYENTDDDDFTISGKYNTWFFVNKIAISEARTDSGTNSTLTINAGDFKYHFERRRITSPTITNRFFSEKYPPNFNKVTFPYNNNPSLVDTNAPSLAINNDGTLLNILKLMYNMVFNDPRELNKGFSFRDKLYTIKYPREILGFNFSFDGISGPIEGTERYFVFNTTKPSTDVYVMNENRGTFLPTINKVFNFFEEIDIQFTYYPWLKIAVNGIPDQKFNEKFNIILNQSKLVTIDPNQAKLVNYNFSIDDSNTVNFVTTVDSSENLTTYYYDYGLADNLSFSGGSTLNTKRQITTFEEYSEVSYDDTTPSSLLADNSKSIINENKTKIEVSVELENTNLNIMTDIHQGDVLDLQGYNEFVDGKYKISKITEVIEDGYIFYTFDVLKRNLEGLPTMSDNIKNIVDDKKGVK